MYKDEGLTAQYTHAREDRATKIFEEVLSIADDSSNDTKVNEDGIASFNNEFAARSKIRIDARKWMLGKMQPKKYGDSQLIKLGDNEGDKLKVNAIFANDIMNVPTNDSTSEDS